MDSLIKILVVEDEMIIAAKISMQLEHLGYEVTGILPRGEEAIIHIHENKPDIIILDINLKGEIDGIETASRMQSSGIPVIYLTANAEDATFNRAKATGPAAFISKPFKQLDLQRAIELAISRMVCNEAVFDSKINAEADQSYILSDRIFVKNKDKMVKLMLADILFIEADRNYCRIFTAEKEYLLSLTLKTMEEKLPSKDFLRIHRSYMVNIKHIDEVAECHVLIMQKTIPLSTGLKEQLMERIQTL